MSRELGSQSTKVTPHVTISVFSTGVLEILQVGFAVKHITASKSFSFSKRQREYITGL